MLFQKKNESTIVKEKITKTDSIITDSDKPGFTYDLIETKKVPVGDTVLFREWTGLAKKQLQFIVIK